MYFPSFLILLVSVSYTEAAFDLAWNTDSDLTSFVTRPEIKAPTFDVAIYDNERVTPGYWFLGPYATIVQPPNAPKYYSACQTGPHIYDQNGELVWSGACLFKNQNACDFRAWSINGSDYLSTILYKYKNDTVGHGVILDSSYQPVQKILPPPELPGLYVFEYARTQPRQRWNRGSLFHISDLPGQPLPYGYIMNMGVREVDLRTGELLFEWWAHPEVSLLESNVEVSQLQGPYPNAWNWFHGNSIVKNAAGDYLVNSRYTDTVYKISGKTSKIIWRLGGRKSDFEMIDFDFSRQHDARWMEDLCDDNVEMITLLDNGSDGITSTANTSSAIQVKLDKTTMTATLVKRWIRPDEGRSDLRGNFQHLPNGNVFAAWSDNSFISEFTSEGDLVMAAEFSSERFVTYRTYKFNFTGRPIEPPVTKAFVYGVDEQSATTVVYMSWNGATEVVHWDVYRVVADGSMGELVGSVARTGFETRFQMKGFAEEVYVKAIAADGTVLGETDSYKLKTPREWSWQVNKEDLSLDEKAVPPTGRVEQKVVAAGQEQAKTEL